MNLNLFENREKNNNSLVEKFIDELKNALTSFSNKNKNQNNDLDEYNLFEKSRKGNDLAWITDENSVCVSEHGDGGPYFISEIDLPKNVKTRRSI